VDKEQFEVIVAIDGQDAATEMMLDQLEYPYRLRWARLGKNGPGAARNLGASLADGRILLLLDDDILLVPDGVAEHLAAHEGYLNRVCLGQVRAGFVSGLTAWEAYLNQRYEEHYDKLARPDYQPDYRDCMSGNMSLPRALFQQAGGFDAGFGTTRHDDIEFAYRLARLGVEFVHRPAALGHHLFVKDTDDGLRDAFANGASSVKLVRLHPGLNPHPALERWRRYSGRAQGFFRWALSSPGRIRQWTRLSRLLLILIQIQKLPAPRPVRLAIFRLAYHLYFWWGVFSEEVPAFVGSTRRRNSKLPLQ
jgi:glycosyltransferase involved in cell wall biosynthesis